MLVGKRAKLQIKNETKVQGQAILCITYTQIKQELNKEKP